MMLYSAVIDDADRRQLLAIKGRLASLEQRVDEILPMSQFNAFLFPSDEPEEIDIWVAIEGELTRPQLSSLEREIQSTAGKKRSAHRPTSPRIVEKLIQL